MKKYCAKCGTKLTDEKVCPKCEQTNAPFLKDLVQKPIDTVLKQCRQDNVRLGYLLILLTSASIALFGILFLKQYFTPIAFFHHATYGIRHFIVIFAFSFVSFWLFGSLLYWMQREWFHGVMTYQESIIVTGLSSLAITCTMIICMLLISAPFILLFGLITLSCLLFILVIYAIIEKKSQIDLNQLPYFLVMVIGIVGILLFLMICLLR